MTSALPSWGKILPAAERFVLVLDDEAVLDRETGLVWERNTHKASRNWTDASGYCYKLEFGGRKGWRLPTIDELATLVDSSQDPALPMRHLFTNVKLSNYWSSTTHTYGTDYAWHVDFSNGGVVGSSYKWRYYYVRAVRSGQ
ncbi:MAG: DUF1566 domain-containing protein [Pseudomonadota bacterium]|nr:DUF1566 domain-containing protein [Pseudomonadota bacterium]